MDADTTAFISFTLFMLFFAGVGLASMRVKKDTTDDYLVAGRGMHPALAALSAVSTWNSGYMFIGFISFVYLMGYAAIWIGVISTVGQLVAWIWLYRHIQREAAKQNVRSLSSLVSTTRGAPEAKLAAILSVLFLSIYAAAQLTAGGVALNAILGWEKIIGILIGFVLVVAYCYAGGVRASIWTDAAQSVVMIAGSTLLCITALSEVGGFSGLHDQLTIVDPATTEMFPYGLKFGLALWLFAFFLGGLGVAGQPQVVSRVMTLGEDKDRIQAMIWFFVWQTPFIALMFIIGLVSRAIFFDGSFDPEMGLPVMALEVLSPFWVGLILASIFAATMSTADSLVLACTAAITDDVKPEWSEDHKTTKRVTLFMAVFATLISLVALWTKNDSVFDLVVLAVYGLGSIFIPLLILQIMGYKPDSVHTIVMMVTALTSVTVWSLSDYSSDIFPSIPGIGSAFIAHFVLCRFRKDSSSNPFGTMFHFLSKNENADVIEARYLIRPKQVLSAGIIALFLVVGLESVYVISDPPEPLDAGANSGALYRLEITTNTVTYSEIFDLDDGQSIDFETNVAQWGLPEDAGAIYQIRFQILYDDTRDNSGQNICDIVTTTPDFNAVEGPLEAVVADQQTNEECGNPVTVAYVYQTSLDAIITNSTGPKSSMNEYTSRLADQTPVQGDFIITLSLETQTLAFFTNDAGESVEVIVTIDYVETVSQPTPVA